MYVLIFDNFGLGYILGDFSKKASGHPGRMRVGKHEAGS
jgi:hypothetical protein